MGRAVLSMQQARGEGQENDRAPLDVNLSFELLQVEMVVVLIDGDAAAAAECTRTSSSSSSSSSSWILNVFFHFSLIYGVP